MKAFNIVHIEIESIDDQVVSETHSTFKAFLPEDQARTEAADLEYMAQQFSQDEFVAVPASIYC